MDWVRVTDDLERLVSEFARELRSAAGRSDSIGDGALGDLRNILSDTLARIRDEVFPGDQTGPDPATRVVLRVASWGKPRSFKVWAARDPPLSPPM